MEKHAFLIMAHKDSLTLDTLIRQIDCENIDIFLHMDKKHLKYETKRLHSYLKKSHLFHTKRIDVTWGGYSQIEAELILLDAATSKGSYKYYHLLSGQDLLINSLDNLFDFYNQNYGKEFVNFQNQNFMFQDRVRFYSLQDYVKSRKKVSFMKIVNKIGISIQKMLKVNRNKNINFQKGTNWFSITDDLARYILLKKDWIENVFKFTSFTDEVFIQTIVHNSNFRSNLYNPNYDNNHQNILREIDWNRGTPYTFKLEDFEELNNSKMFFARKFDENVDEELIEKIFITYNKQ